MRTGARRPGFEDSPGPRLLLSEGEPHLQLEHPRRIDVCERRKRICGSAYRHQLTERWIRESCVSVNRLSTAEVVSVIEEIEPLQPKQNTRALRSLDAAFDKHRHLGGRTAAKRRLADHLAVNDRS